jgi:16S rRNA (cytidine1402-2'-O)-methyltransferase
VETLNDAIEVFGDRKVAVCRELTKVYEEVFRGRLSQAIEHFAQPRGEFTLVIEGKARQDTEIGQQIEKELRKLYQQGTGAKEAVARLSEASGISKKKLYQTWLKVTKGD